MREISEALRRARKVLKAIDEIIEPSDSVKLTRAYEIRRVLNSARQYLIRRYSYSDATRLIANTLEDLQDLIAALEARMPKPPSLWKRFKTWANRSTSGKGPFKFADGGFISDCTRQQPHQCTVNGPCNGWPRSTPFTNRNPVFITSAGTLSAAEVADFKMRWKANNVSRQAYALFALAERERAKRVKSEQFTHGDRPLWFRDTLIVHSTAYTDTVKCKQFDGSIPCWMFRGNEEVKIKQWQEICRLNKCVIEVTYNGRDWYMSDNTDLCRIFDSVQDAKDGIAANSRRYPNDVSVRRIRRLLTSDDEQWFTWSQNQTAPLLQRMHHAQPED